MTYQRHLSFHLRGRGYREDEIVGIIHDLEEHGTTRAELAHEFGKPREYADRFPRRTGRRTRGARLLLIAGVLAVAWLAMTLLAGIMSDVALAELAGPVVLWPPLGLLVAGVLAGFLTDYLRPAPSRT